MADIWQTIEQAAVTLGLSVRTVNRHITAGKLESRLFEGRREVRIPASANFASASSASPQSGTASARVNGDSSAATDTATETRHSPSATNGTPSDTETREEYASSERDSYSHNRQRVTADIGADRPMDTNTFLALADSLDDKATLAVAAYQTLARTAETQVQSLRKVALGAWAVVGVMAIGIIVAVGWVTWRLTTAETTAIELRQQVSRQDQQLQQQLAGRDEAVQRISAERDAAREDLGKMRDEKSRLEGRTQLLSEQAKAAQEKAEKAEQAAFVLRSTTRPTTQPLGAAGSSATQPVVADGSAALGATSRPTSKTGRPTYLTNSEQAFDPK
jgi:hypothetical protein